MVKAQEHRGPDGSLVWGDERVALGHSRLRVLDLNERSDQPFFWHASAEQGNERGTPSILVYNGELYNHVELRRELEQDGLRFRTQSDTEVLYAALLRWGGEAVRHLRGMFSFVYYEPGRRVLAARDRHGIKPLHVSMSKEGMAFASEPRGILASGRLSGELDEVAVHQASRFNHLLGGRSAFQGIESVLAGEQWDIDMRTMAVTKERYHQNTLRTVPRRSFKERVARLDEAYERSVRRHLIADRPVASFLSGGIDSTALASSASRQSSLTTYSMTFPGHENDESSYIRDARAAIDAEHRTLAITDVSFQDYAAYVEHAAMPQLWTTDLSLYLLSARVRRGGHQVVLSGEGPDELFAGYDSFRWMRMRELAQRTGLTRLLSRLPQRDLKLSSLSWFDIDLAMIRFYAEAHATAEKDGTRERYGFYPENLASWGIAAAAQPSPFARDFRARWPEYRAHAASTIRESGVADGETSLQRNLLFETNVRLPNWVLPMADRMSSAHGVELRVPYLDDAFVEEAMSLPDRDRLRGLNEKHILKEMHRKRVPKTVYQRHKQALYTPITPWAQKFLQDERCRGLLLETKDGFYDNDAVRSLVERMSAGRYEGMLDQLSTEWSTMLVLSTRILAQHARELPRAHTSCATLPRAQGIA